MNSTSPASVDTPTSGTIFVPTAARTMPIEPAPAAARGTNVFLPLLLLSLAFTGWSAFQSVQLGLEHRQLIATGESLATSEQQSVAVRHSLDSLASATAKLADSGNPNARRIVEELRSRGITINPSASPTPP